MTKQQLQQELLEKVKPGTKPSQLKKSKSTGNLPAKNIQPTEPLRRNSVEPIVKEESLTKKLEKAQDEISILELKLETQARELSELNSLTEENKHLKEQAKNKQQDLETLRKQLEEKSQQLSLARSELEASLTARHKSLKDWNTEHSKRIQNEKELDNTIEESAEELVSQDEKITELRIQLARLIQTNQTLQKDLNLTQRLAELRKINRTFFFKPQS